MEQQTNGVHMTKEQQEKYNNWDKMQIYEAYLFEHEARVYVENTANKLRIELAEARRYISLKELREE